MRYITETGFGNRKTIRAAYKEARCKRLGSNRLGALTMRSKAVKRATTEAAGRNKICKLFLKAGIILNL